MGQILTQVWEEIPQSELEGLPDEVEGSGLRSEGGGTWAVCRCVLCG